MRFTQSAPLTQLWSIFDRGPNVYWSNPPGTVGYYRGSPNYGGQGSGQGGTGVSAKGFLTGSATEQTGWTPTILYLFVLIIAEMFVFGWISRKI